MFSNTFKPIQIMLLFPIEVDDKPDINDVTIGLIDKATHKRLFKLYDEDDPTHFFMALIEESCDLSSAEVERLSMPDYNTIVEVLSDLVSKTSEYLIQKNKSNSQMDEDEPELYCPIKDDTGMEITFFKIRVPTVKSLTLMNSFKEEETKSIFILKDCTGLTDSEINRLTMPDYNYLTERVNHFLYQPASYFHPKTSNA